MNVMYQCTGYHTQLRTCISAMAHLGMWASLMNYVLAGINFPMACTRLLPVKNKGSRPDNWGSYWGAMALFYCKKRCSLKND